MITVIFVHSLDRAARVDPESLPEQTLMEIFVSNMKGKDEFQDAHGEFLPVHRWKGVTTDAEGAVEEIRWENGYAMYDDYSDALASPGGTIDFKYASRRLESFSATNMELYGTVETRYLPDTMQCLRIAHNFLSGTFDLSGLPENIVRVDIEGNEFTGSLDFTNVPETLAFFDGANNEFSGSLDLTRLSDFIQDIDLNGNSLSGDIDLRRVPKHLQILSLHDNAFKANVLDLGAMPLYSAEIRMDKGAFQVTVHEAGRQARIAHRGRYLAIMGLELCENECSLQTLSKD